MSEPARDEREWFIGRTQGRWQVLEGEAANLTAVEMTVVVPEPRLTAVEAERDEALSDRDEAREIGEGESERLNAAERESVLREAMREIVAVRSMLFRVGGEDRKRAVWDQADVFLVRHNWMDADVARDPAFARSALSEPSSSEEEKQHVLAVESSFTRPGQWVVCSCGWASPDVAFPTDAEAVEWARGEHLGSSSEEGA